MAASASYHWTVAPDGKSFVSVNPHDGLRTWDGRDGREWRHLSLDGQDKASSLAFSGDDQTLLLAGAGKLHVRDWPSGKLRRVIDLQGRAVRDLLPSSDGRTAHVLLESETVMRRFDLDTGAESATTREGHRGIVSEFALGPGGKLVSAGYDGSVQVWDLKRGRVALAFRPKNGCIFMALGDDGKLLAAVDWERTAVAVHECDTGRLLRTIETGKPIRYLAFAPRGRLLLTGEDIPARVFRVWDAGTGRVVRQLEGEVYNRPAFSPDGRRLAALSAKTVRLIDFPRGKELFSLPEGGRYGLGFSPDGRTLACGDWKAITLWDLTTRKQQARIKLNKEGCTALRFSVDGRWLAWAEDEQVQLWDLRKNRRLHTFRGHEGNVTDLRFTPDGRALVSASTDSTLLVWDLTVVRGK
jgi:WD40 repeat protein